MSPSPPEIRFPIEPRDVPPAKAARRLHLTLAEFTAALPDLYRRGFPRPDETTGYYFLPAVDRWMESRDTPISDDPISERIARM
jgi:hypothetical protein